MSSIYKNGHSRADPPTTYPLGDLADEFKLNSADDDLLVIAHASPPSTALLATAALPSSPSACVQVLRATPSLGQGEQAPGDEALPEEAHSSPAQGESSLQSEEVVGSSEPHSSHRPEGSEGLLQQ